MARNHRLGAAVRLTISGADDTPGTLFYCEQHHGTLFSLGELRIGVRTKRLRLASE